MVLMIVGLVVLLGTHVTGMFPSARAGAIRALGMGPYRAVHGIVSLVGLVLVIKGYADWRFAGSVPLYDPPVWLSHITLLLMWIAFVLLAATYGTSHIRYGVRFPMVTAVKVWAFAHLLANGDAASVVLFGAFLAWAVAVRISLKRRERAGLVTSRDFTPTARGDVIALAIGTIVYVLFVWKLHLWLIGVSPLAM